MAEYLREDDGQHLAAAIYGGSFLAMAVAFYAMQRHLMLRPRAAGADDRPRGARGRSRRRNRDGLIPYRRSRPRLRRCSSYLVLAICAAVGRLLRAAVGEQCASGVVEGGEAARPPPRARAASAASSRPNGLELDRGRPRGARCRRRRRRPGRSATDCGILVLKIRGRCSSGRIRVRRAWTSRRRVPGRQEARRARACRGRAAGRAGGRAARRRPRRGSAQLEARRARARLARG